MYQSLKSLKLGLNIDGDTQQQQLCVCYLFNNHFSLHCTPNAGSTNQPAWRLFTLRLFLCKCCSDKKWFNHHFKLLIKLNE